MKLHTLASLSFVLLAACGSKSKGDATADPCKDPCKDIMRTFDGPLEGGEWENLSKADRAEFMKQVVMPTMKKEFQEFDPEEFAEFDCATCHGQGAAPGGDFEMPNPDLPVLTMETFQNPPEEDKLILEFMSMTVKPQMANLIGEPEMTQTQEGFGCMECHTMAEQ